MSQSHLSCYTRPESRRLVLAIEGALDLVTAPQAAEALQQFISEHGPSVIVDASRLNFIDSKGVGTLISAAKQARDAGGRLFLREPTLPVKKILEMCGLMELFPEPPAREPAAEVSEVPAAAAAVRPAQADAPRAARPAKRAA